MSVIVYPALSTDHVGCGLGRIKERCAIFTKKNIFAILTKVIDPTNLSGSTVIWVRAMPFRSFLRIDWFTQIVMHFSHLLKCDLNPSLR